MLLVEVSRAASWLTWRVKALLTLKCLESISGHVKSDTVSPAARHLCDFYLVLCLSKR